MLPKSPGLFYVHTIRHATWSANLLQEFVNHGRDLSVAIAESSTSKIDMSDSKLYLLELQGLSLKPAETTGTGALEIGCARMYTEPGF